MGLCSNKALILKEGHNTIALPTLKAPIGISQLALITTQKHVSSIMFGDVFIVHTTHT